MFDNYTFALWLLKLGALPNLYFLMQTAATNADPSVLVTAAIFFAVAFYRCLFPVRYEHYVVLHDSPLSSVFATRLLATFAEVAYIYLLALVLWRLNVEDVGWVNVVAGLMVAQAVVCQGFVWTAILGERFDLYFHEELGWLLMYLANTIASAGLYLTTDTPSHGILVWNLVFAVPYLPFQVANLIAVRAKAQEQGSVPPLTLARLVSGLRRSIQVKTRRTDAASWGGIVGLIWMAGYWVTVLPLWVYAIVRVLARN